MADVVIAPSNANVRAAEAVERHHAQMCGVLAGLAESLVAAVARSDFSAAEQGREQLADWCEQELLPHALAEEESLYPSARATVEGRLLVDGMIAEHELIDRLVWQVRTADDPIHAVAAATALRVVFESHLAKENELVLPLLLRTPGVSIAELGGTHELLGEDAHEPSSGCGSGGSCSCGEPDPAGHPELDARIIPHAIRHATIFGALETVSPGAGLVLVAPHDPIPLLAQIGDRWPGRFRVDYLEAGPESWRLLFARDAA